MAMYLGDKPVKAIERGKNLLNAGILTFSGVGGGVYFPLDLNGTYTFQYKTKLSKIADTDAALVRIVVDGNPRYRVAFANDNHKTTITGHITAIDFVNWSAATGVVYDVMLSEGETALLYEPYNLSLAAPIKKCVGNNLFDINSLNGKVTYDDEGYWNFAKGYYTANPIRLEAGKTYTVSYTAEQHDKTGGAGSRLCVAVLSGKDGTYFNGAQRLVIRLVYSYNVFSTTAKFTVPEGDNWVSLGITGGCRFKEFMLNEGDTALPYEPYREWYEY